MASWMSALLRRIVRTRDETRSNGTIFGMSRAVYAAVSGGRIARGETGGIAAWRRGVTLIAQYVGRVPCHVYRGRERDRQHAAHVLVRRWARRDLVSAQSFRETLTLHALHRGNGYAEIVRDGAARAVELCVLPPEAVKLVETELGWRYAVSLAAGSTRTVHPSDMIHIRGIGWDELVGDDTLAISGTVLRHANALADYARSCIENGGAPGAVMEFDQTLDDPTWLQVQERLRASLDTGDVLVSDGGGKVKPWGATPDALQVIQSRQMSATEVALLLNLDPAQVGVSQGKQYGTLREANAAFLDATLEPWFVRFEEQYDKLFAEDERDSGQWRAEFVREALRRADYVGRTASLVQATGGPIMTTNEAADVLGLPRRADGDTLRQTVSRADATLATDDGTTHDEEDE